jgi:hypothetical protein
MKQTHCCGARPTRPLRLSFSQSAPKIPCFLCVLRRRWRKSEHKRALRGGLEAKKKRKSGRFVDELWMSCGLQGSIHHSLVASLFAFPLVSFNCSNKLIRKEAIQQGQTLQFPNRKRRF